MTSKRTSHRQKRLVTETKTVGLSFGVVKDHPLCMHKSEEEASLTTVDSENLYSPIQEKHLPSPSGVYADNRSSRPSFVSHEMGFHGVSKRSRSDNRELMASLLDRHGNIFDDYGNEYEQALEEKLSEAMTDDAFSIDMSQTLRPATSKSCFSFNLQDTAFPRECTRSGKKHRVQQWFSNLGATRPTSPGFSPKISFDSLDNFLHTQPPRTPDRPPYRPASRSSLPSNRSGNSSIRLKTNQFLTPDSSKQKNFPIFHQTGQVDSPEELSVHTPNSSSPALSFVTRSRQSSHHDDSIFDGESVVSEDMRQDVVKNLVQSLSSSVLKRTFDQQLSDIRTARDISRVPSNASFTSTPGPVELERIVPYEEQSPMLLLTWNKHYRCDEKPLTDRYGFIHKNRKQKESIPGTRTRTGSFTRTSSSRTDRRRSLSFVDVRLLRSQQDAVNALYKFKSLPVTQQSSFLRPTIDFATPNFCTKMEDALDDVEMKQASHDQSASMQNLLEHMIDAHDALQRIQKERWDKYLKKIYKDKRLESPDVNNDGEMIGISRMGKSRLFETWKEFKSLVYSGVPVVYRAKVWAECSGANQLRQPGYYDDLVSESTDADSVNVQQIDMDINRTMPNNVFFGGKGPGVPKLRRLLLAFSRHNRAIGYCQGMNVIAATLLLTHYTEEDAFWVLVSIVEKILPEGYFTPDLITSRADQRVLKRYIKELCPKLHSIFTKTRVDIENVTFGWFLSIFTDCLPPEALFRVWDVLFIEGNTFLWRVALAIIQINEKSILARKSAAALYSYLKNMTRHTFSIDILLARCEELKPRIRPNIAIRRRAEEVERLRREMMGIIDDGG